MKWLLTCLVGVITLTTSGCVYALLTDTPVKVIHRNVACPTMGKSQAKEFQVLGTHRWSKGVIVLYSALCPTNDAKSSLQRVFGHQVVKRDGMNWQVSSSASYGMNSNTQASEKLIEYGTSKFKEVSDTHAGPGKTESGKTERYTILYGQILTPKVTAVEVTFDNGRVMRDEGLEGAFALVSPGSAGVCELRILGADNQILRKEYLSAPDPLDQPKRLVSDRPNTSSCLRPTHQL